MTTEEAKPVVRRQFEDIVKSAGSDCGGQKFRKRLLGHGDDAPPGGGTERVAGNDRENQRQIDSRESSFGELPGANSRNAGITSRARIRPTEVPVPESVGRASGR